MVPRLDAAYARCHVEEATWSYTSAVCASIGSSLVRPRHGKPFCNEQTSTRARGVASPCRKAPRGAESESSRARRTYVLVKHY